MRTEQDRLFEAHDKEGRRLFGKKRWNEANFGWGQSDNSISSKVYGDEPKVLTSWFDKSGQAVHEVTDY